VRRLPENALGPNLPLNDPAAVCEALGIAPGDRVLDVGGAGNPFPRANVVADLTFASAAQRNGAPAVLRRDVQYVECPVESLPFEDDAFDFVYCTQVLEHVADPAAACREISRVARRGFVEVPSRTGEMLNGNPTHRWIIDVEEGVLVFHPRKFIDHPLENFFYAVILRDEKLRRLAEVDYRNLINHQILFEEELRSRVVAAADANVFDYDDALQAGRSHYSFARNIFKRGGDPSYTLPDAALASRLMPSAAAPRILEAAHLLALGRRREALAALGEEMGHPQIAGVRRMLADEAFAGALPLPPADPLELGEVKGGAAWSQPLVSVVVAGRDPGRIRASVESALTQDYPHVEVLVGAAMSEEEGNEALKGLSMGERLRLLALGEEAPIGACLNRAGAASRGRLLAFLLEGERHQAWHLDRMVTHLLATRADGVLGDRLVLDTGEVLSGHPGAAGTCGAVLSLSTLVARREALLRGGAFDEAAGDEAPLAGLRVLLRKLDLRHVPEASVECPTLPADTPREALRPAEDLDPLHLLRALMAAHAREQGLLATIQELERRLAGEKGGA